MNRKEIITEIKPLDKTATYKNKGKEMSATIKGKNFLFRFIGTGDTEELITILYNGMLIFADTVKFRNDTLCFNQNNGVFVARIQE